MSTADYSKAVWLPSPNFWPGGDGNQLIVVHATASGGPQTGYQLATSAEFTDGKSKSVHYINDVDGTVYQIVNEANSSWGNCCVDGNSPFSASYNWNRNTISIENVKHSSDNSEPLTPAQYQSLLALIRDIAKRNSIPLAHGSPTTRGIIFHHDLMPIQKAGCPGTFPYDTFFQDLQQGGISQSVKTNSDGTIATTPFWYQLSEDEMDTCGPTTCAMALFSVPPGGQLVATAETIDQETDAIIQDVFRISDPKQFGGVDTWSHDMSNILLYLKNKYKKLDFRIVSTMEDLERGIHAGYIGIFGCNEADVTAWNKNKQAWEHAYTWNLSAGHIPGVVVGIEAHTGNWLVVDPLNNRFQGYGPPYIYKRSDIAKSFTGGAIIQLTDWLAPIPAITNWPANFNAQQGGTSVAIPSGWKPGPNNGLIAPNNVPVLMGMATWIQAHTWDAGNLPIKPEVGKNPVENSNPALGIGTWQNFRGTPGQPAALAWRKDTNQVYVPWVGQELQWYMDSYNAQLAQHIAQTAQIATLKAQIATLEAAITTATGGTIPQAVLDDIAHLAGLIPPAAAALETLVHDAGITLPPPPTTP